MKLATNTLNYHFQIGDKVATTYLDHNPGTIRAFQILDREVSVTVELANGVQLRCSPDELAHWDESPEDIMARLFGDSFHG